MCDLDSVLVGTELALGSVALLLKSGQRRTKRAFSSAIRYGLNCRQPLLAWARRYNGYTGVPTCDGLKPIGCVTAIYKKKIGLLRRAPDRSQNMNNSDDHQNRFCGSHEVTTYKPTKGDCSSLLNSFKNGAQRPNQERCSGLQYLFKNHDRRLWRGILECDAMMLWGLDPEVDALVVKQILAPCRRRENRPPKRVKKK